MKADTICDGTMENHPHPKIQLLTDCDECPLCEAIRQLEEIRYYVRDERGECASAESNLEQIREVLDEYLGESGEDEGIWEEEG